MAIHELPELRMYYIISYYHNFHYTNINYSIT